MSASAKLSRMVCLLTGFFSTGISMASSLILPSATDLAGRWTLQQDEAPAICQLGCAPAKWRRPAAMPWAATPPA